MRKALLMIIAAMIAGTAMADPSRTMFVQDDRITEEYVREVSLRYDSAELPGGGDVTAFTTSMRYGAFEHMDFFVRVPYIEASGVSGFGDIGVGVEVLAHGPVRRGEASFFAHAQANLATGDEDKGLGAGETTFLAGVGMTSRLTGELNGTIEGRYVKGVNNNQVLVGIALINDMGPRSAVTAECLNRIVDSEFEVSLAVGLVFYELFDSKDFSFGFSAGVTDLTDRSDTIFAARGSYEF